MMTTMKGRTTKVLKPKKAQRTRMILEQMKPTNGMQDTLLRIVTTIWTGRMLPRQPHWTLLHTLRWNATTKPITISSLLQLKMGI
jgi:hypothetical protein